MPNIYEYPVDLANRRMSYYWQVKFLEGAKKILEIGCSTGFLSKHLIARGSQVVGVENNPESAALAAQVCERVIVGDIEDEAIQVQITEQFDGILLGDVLEHLLSPENLLEKIREKWLAPGGRVVISIPNSGHWIFRREVLWGRFPYRERGLFDRTHLRFYTRRSLWKMIASAGYEIERWAVTANFNRDEDITFTLFQALYRLPGLRGALNRLEGILARMFPSLFAYQFVLSIQTRAGAQTRELK